MAFTYYCSELSENMGETPDGYLICQNAVIGRTGFHQYKANELPSAMLQQLGVSFNQDDLIEVYRNPEELFSPESMASYESKPFTDDHPYEFVDITTHGDVAKGHVRNVRRGDEPLADGNYPLLADIIVTNPSVREKVLSQRKRELSTGHTYKLALLNNVLTMIDTRGNHVSLVDKGRSGRTAKIYNSNAITTERLSMSKLKQMWEGMGFKSWAATAEPHEIGEYLSEARINNSSVPVVKNEDTTTDDGMETRMRAAFDKFMSERSAAESAQDEDMEKLKEMISGEAENEEMSEEEKKKKEDEEAQNAKATNSAAYIEGQRVALRALKPFVAKANNSALLAAFETATKLTNSVSKGTNGYQVFSEASTARATNAEVNEGNIQKKILDSFAASLDARKAGR